MCHIVHAEGWLRDILTQPWRGYKHHGINGVGNT